RSTGRLGPRCGSANSQRGEAPPVEVIADVALLECAEGSRPGAADASAVKQAVPLASMPAVVRTCAPPASAPERLEAHPKAEGCEFTSESPQRLEERPRAKTRCRSAPALRRVRRE